MEKKEECVVQLESLVAISPRSFPSVEPVLGFRARLKFQHGRSIPTELTVRVYTEDKKLLAIALPFDFGKGELALALRGDTTDVVRDVELALPLTRRQIDHIEAVRERNSKGDVVLQCNVAARFLTSRMVLAGLEPLEKLTTLGNTNHHLVALNRDGGTRSSRYANMWVASGDGDRRLLEASVLELQPSITLAASDWLNDYASVWSDTRHMVIELPRLVAPVDGAPCALRDRINAACEAVAEAGRKFDAGEWSDVVQFLRPVWELLKQNSELKALLQEDGYTVDATNAFLASIEQQFLFASKFAHRTDKQNRVQPDIIANKEDAILCFTFAASALGAVIRKFRRHAT